MQNAKLLPQKLTKESESFMQNKKPFTLRHNRKGFSLVELIVVIVIMLVLAAVMVPNVMKYIGQAREAKLAQVRATFLNGVQAGMAEHMIKYPQDAKGTLWVAIRAGNSTWRKPTEGAHSYNYFAYEYMSANSIEKFEGAAYIKNGQIVDAVFKDYGDVKVWIWRAGTGTWEVMEGYKEGDAWIPEYRTRGWSDSLWNKD